LGEEERNGSRPALPELWARHRGLVPGDVLRMTGDRDLADEVVRAGEGTVRSRLRYVLEALRRALNVVIHP
jgi:DNA-directed RNA polymerase specialized sigma24 family protein